MSHLQLDRSDLIALNKRRNRKERRRVCHIPEKGLYFGFRGHVYTCCYSKSYRLGTYPDQSIRDIWFGDQLKSQRKAIRKRDMSCGCGGCYTMIKNGNLNALPLRNFDRFAARNKGFPAKMDFELFNTCNLECIMCRGEFSSTIRKNREGLPPIGSPYDDAFFDQLEEFIPHLKSSHFLGGEPFLIPQYVDLWERMAKLNPGMSVSVQTNGTVLNGRIRKLLDEMDFHLSLSMDSIVADNFEVVRKNAKYDRVIEHLKFFREYTRSRNTLLTFSYCPMPQNWKELPDVIHFCNGYNMPVKFNTVETPPECSLANLGATELTEIVAYLESFVHPESNPVEAQNRQSYLDQIAQIKGWEEKAKEREQSGITEKAGSFEEFISQIDSLLGHSGKYTPQEIKGLVTEIREKLIFVLDQADKQGLRNSAEAKMIAVDPNLIIRSLPGIPKEELLVLFESFVMPIQ